MRHWTRRTNWSSYGKPFQKLPEQDEGRALRAVLESRVAGYTRQEATPEGLMVRHNPDGTRQLVRINLERPDTIIRPL